MSIDTKLKLFSATQQLTPWTVVGNLPVSTIDADDRQAVSHVYSGVLASVAAIGISIKTLVTAMHSKNSVTSSQSKNSVNKIQSKNTITEFC